MNLATEKEFADIKITTVNLSTEIISKFYELNILNKIEKFLWKLNFVFFHCVVNSNQLRQDLKVAEGKITRDLRGTIKLKIYVKLLKFETTELFQQPQLIWKTQKPHSYQPERIFHPN
jgi:hypothetical protein